SLERLHYLLTRPCELSNEARRTGEADQQGSIKRSEHSVQKHPQILLVSLDEFRLAAAQVHHQRKAQRNVRALRKEGDLLRSAILEDLEIVLGQVPDQFAGRIADREAYVHE